MQPGGRGDAVSDAADSDDLEARLGEVQARLDAMLDLQAFLSETARALGPALELQPVLGLLLQAMRRLVQFRGGSISLVTDGHLQIVAADPVPSPEVLALRLPVGSGLAGRACASAKTIYCPDLDADRRVDPKVRATGSNQEMVSYLVVPLVCLGEVIGVLQVDSREVDAFTPDDIRTLEGLATQMAGSIESARRHEAMVRLEQDKTDFIARVSHELRTPLTVVSGFARTLAAADDAFTGEQRAEILDRMVKATDRLADLVEELLTVTRMQAWSSRVVPELTEVAAVLGEVVEQSADPGRLTVDCPFGLTAETDPVILKQVLTLLIQNALVYAGGATVKAWADPDTRRIRVAVVDHGPGVAPELAPRIFDRFVRGDTGIPGMGLGLALVKTLADSLHATVELSDTPGGGATFTVAL